MHRAQVSLQHSHQYKKLQYNFQRISMLKKAIFLLAITASFATTSHAFEVHCSAPIQNTNQRLESPTAFESPPSSLKVNFIPRSQKKPMPFEKTYRDHEKIPDIERSEILWDTYYSKIEPRFENDIQAAMSRQIPDIPLTDEAEYKINVRASGATIQFKSGATELTMYYSLIAYKTTPRDAIWRRMCSTVATKPLSEEDSSSYTEKLAEDLIQEVSRLIKPTAEVAK